MSKFMKTVKNSYSFQATVEYDEKVARKSTNTAYYKAQGINMKEFNKMEQGKIDLATPKWPVVTALLDSFRNKGFEEPIGSAKVLNGIYNKNRLACAGGITKQNSNLLSVIANPEVLALAYREIRGNKGALTSGAAVSPETYNNMTEEQKQLYLDSFSLPDGINLNTFVLIGKLLRKGMYPWGSSKRIYFDKPGQPGKKRPITIPPFTDIIVQKTITMVLEAIYEPYFDKLNCSFGFRPTFGTQDALIALTSRGKANGMRTAVEGDVEAAYDTVNKEILLKILGKRITDKKFLELLRDRLDYDFVETTEEGTRRVKPELGIPQGGIDSPYLFNIYMNELDSYVKLDLQTEIEYLNKKLPEIRTKPGGFVRKYNKNFNSVRAYGAKLYRRLDKIKGKLSKLPQAKREAVFKLRASLFKVVKAIRYSEHLKNRISSATSNQKVLRVHYIRYADDWILLTNGNKEIGTLLKDRISSFLSQELGLKLSPTKTLITDITKNCSAAKFLGCELRISARGALRKRPVPPGLSSLKKNYLHKISGLLLWAKPDRQRLINRMFMKGFCSRSGHPKEIPWLSCLEGHTIIDRFNASIRGLAEFYLPVIKYPYMLSRWIYILRFSCLKTLAQKYNCSIKEIFKRFGHNLSNKSTQTVKFRVMQTIREKTLYKDWILLTYKDLLFLVKSEERSRKLHNAYLARDKGILVDTGGSPRLQTRTF